MGESAIKTMVRNELRPFLKHKKGSRAPHAGRERCRRARCGVSPRGRRRRARAASATTGSIDFGSGQKNLEKGVHYKVKSLPQKKRKLLLQEAIKYCNHKLAKENEALFLEKVVKDTTFGCVTVFPVVCTDRIGNGEVYPLGVQFQNTDGAEGEMYEKARHHTNFSEWPPPRNECVT